MNDALKRLAASLAGKATFEYVFQNGRQRDSYFSNQFESSTVTPAGFAICQIAAWIGNQQIWRMSVTK